jgi:hypothetical protein
LTRQNAVELARREYERGLRARSRLLSLRAEMREAIEELKAPEPELLAIASAVGGPLDGRSVFVDPMIRKLGQTLDRLDDLEPSRIPPLTPYRDEDPQTVRRGDEWVRAWSAGEIDPECQPERIERPTCADRAAR